MTLAYKRLRNAVVSIDAMGTRTLSLCAGLAGQPPLNVRRNASGGGDVSERSLKKGLDMVPVRSISPLRRETFTPGEYVRLPGVVRTNIASVRVVPPTLGSGGFGAVEVEYKHPVYRRATP
jgi:hypothetical protein